MGDFTQVTATAGLRCRHCHLPARLLGSPVLLLLEPEMSRAVHAGTGLEQCAAPAAGDDDGDGSRLCAPVAFETAAMRGARQRAALGFL